MSTFAEHVRLPMGETALCYNVLETDSCLRIHLASPTPNFVDPYYHGRRSVQ